MNDSWKKFDTIRVAAVQLDAYAEVYQEIVGKHEPWLMYEGESELTENQKTF